MPSPLSRGSLAVAGFVAGALLAGFLLTARLVAAALAPGVMTDPLLVVQAGGGWWTLVGIAAATGALAGIAGALVGLAVAATYNAHLRLARWTRVARSVPDCPLASDLGAASRLERS